MLRYLADPLWGVLAGVIISLIFTIEITVKNPSTVPFLRILKRALFGLVLFVLVWFVVASTAYSLVVLKWGDSISPGAGRVIGLFTGLILPQFHLQNVPMQPRWFAQPFRFVAILLVKFTEATTLYFETVVNREERKLVDDLLTGKLTDNYEIAIDRLYEFHSLFILLNLGRNLPKADHRKALGVVECANTALKCTLLLRHLGWTAIHDVKSIGANPLQLLPTWPLVRDRRVLRDRRQSDAGYNPDRRRVCRRSPETA